MESLDRRGPDRRRARHHDDRAGRRARRRLPQRRARPADAPRAAPACRRSSRPARSTWSTSTRPSPCPRRFKDRTFYRHNANVTLMRTTPEENARDRRRDRAQAVGGDRSGRGAAARRAACRRSIARASRSTIRGARGRCTTRFAPDLPGTADVRELDLHINDRGVRRRGSDEADRSLMQARRQFRDSRQFAGRAFSTDSASRSRAASRSSAAAPAPASRRRAKKPAASIS